MPLRDDILSALPVIVAAFLKKYEARFRGDKGDAGPTGKDGVQGPRGPIGPQGPVGPQGPIGLQGPPSEKGGHGEKGEAGRDGKDGRLGPQGPSGPRGPIGPQGPAGKDGLDGKDGKDGKGFDPHDIQFWGGFPALTVTDGSTTVVNARTLKFLSGAVVTDVGGGEADVTITGGGGGTSILLQTNGVNNGSQAKLNLAGGTGISITDGGAGTVTITSTVVSTSDTVFADASNNDIDITNGGAGGAATIITKSVTGITTKDTVKVEMWFSILNNSAAARTYTFTGNVGGFSVIGAAIATLAASATNRGFCKVEFNVAITSALTFGQIHTMVGGPAAANNGTGIANVLPQVWNSTASDLTGTQTVSFQVTSSATTATQTLTLHSWRISKVASKLV